MRKDINWTPDYEPEVGDQVTLFNGTVREYASGNNRNFFRAYASAVGKVSRLVSDPVPHLPDGMRWANDSDKRYPRPAEAMVWTEDGYWCWHTICASNEWLPGRTYILPLATAEKENGAEGIECVVFDHAGFGCLVSPVNPTQKAFNAGDRVRVVPVEGR